MKEENNGEKGPISKPQRNATNVLGATIGTLMQIYDANVYGFMAIVIAQVIFPSSGGNALLLTFLVFGLGYLAGPLGSVYFGHIGDRLGRKTSMLISFWMIGFATLFTGLIPSYASIGLFAPVLILVCRLFAGFGSSGEWGTVGAYLTELGGKKRRAFTSSFQQTTVMVGLLIGVFAGLAVTSFSHNFLYSIGWRIPFIGGGLVLIPIAAVLRFRMAESEKFLAVKEKQEREKVPIVKVLTKYWKPALLTAVAALVWTDAGSFITVYFPTYLVESTTLSLHDSLWVTIGALATLAVFTPVFGYLSDWKLGRKPLALTTSIGFLVVPYPMFYLFHNASVPLGIYVLGGIFLGLIESVMTGVFVGWVSEQFPTNARASAYVPYFIAETFGFGFGPVIAVWAAGAFHNTTYGQVYVMMILAVISTIAIALLKETRGITELHETRSVWEEGA